MKTLLIFPIILFSFISFGQINKFKNEIVDTIKITSNIGVYMFDNKETSKGNSETLTIVYSNSKKCFFIDSYKKSTYEYSNNPESAIVNSKIIKKNASQMIADTLMVELLNGLSGNEKHIKIHKDIFSKLVTERAIRKVAKKYNASHHFKLRFSTKEENQKIFNQIKTLDSLTIYLNDRFDSTSFSLGVTDYTNIIDIEIITKNNKYIYTGQFTRPLRQPWQAYFQKENKLINNLRINFALEKILPKKFLNKKSISSDTFVNDYIAWCLMRNKLISYIDFNRN